MQNQNVSTNEELHDIQMTDDNITIRQQQNIKHSKVLNKRLRMESKVYASYRQTINKKIHEVIRKSRKIGPICSSKICEKSTARMCNLFSDDDRLKIFNHFWSNLNWDEKKLYVNSLVKITPVVRRRVKTSTLIHRKNYNYHYYLKLNNVPVSVCRKMFLNTLSISKDNVYGWCYSKQQAEKQPILKTFGQSREKSDYRSPKSSSVNDFESKLSHNKKTFEADKSHVFESIISIKKIDSLPDIHSKKIYQCDSKQLSLSFNDSVNSTVCEKPENSNNFFLSNTQISLPFSGSSNLATINKGFDKVKRSDQNIVLESTTAHSVDFIVSKIYEKQKELNQQCDTQQIKSTSYSIDFTLNEECDEQKKFNQCDTQKWINSFDAINPATISKHCEKQNQTAQCITLKLPRSTTLEMITNNKSEEPKHFFQSNTQTFSDIVDLTVDEKCDNQKNSNQCDTQQLLSDTTYSAFINEICKKSKKSNQSDTIDLTSDENFDDKNQIKVITSNHQLI